MNNKMVKYILTHDIGTTGNKASIFGIEGNLVGSCYEPYETFYPKRFRVEQKPMDWWYAFCKSTKELLNSTNISPNDIEVVSFSGQMMGAIPVDKSGNLLRDGVLIWSDYSPISQAKRLIDEIGGWDNFYKITGGGQLVENYSIAKIMWYKDNESEIYKRTYKFLHAKDFIINKLTGNYCNDYTDASNSGYMDINKREYSSEILEASGISNEKLPSLNESFTIAGKVNKEASKLTQLPEGLPVVEGAGDVPAANFGAGVINEGLSYIYIGSANWTGVYSKKPILDPETRLVNFCHVIPNAYALHHTAYTGGIAKQWYKDTFCNIENILSNNIDINIYDLLELETEKLKDRPTNMIFIPYLRGGGAPYHNINSSGSIIGLNLAVKKEHILLAIMEGVALNFGVMIDNFKRLGINIDKFNAIGGGAKSRLWMQIYSDVLNKEINRSIYLQEANTLGAAIAGGIGVGIYKNEKILNNILSKMDTFIPNEEIVLKYKELKNIFIEAYNGLEKTFNLLSRIN